MALSNLSWQTPQESWAQCLLSSPHPKQCYQPVLVQTPLWPSPKRKEGQEKQQCKAHEAELMMQSYLPLFNSCMAGKWVRVTSMQSCMVAPHCFLCMLP